MHDMGIRRAFKIILFIIGIALAVFLAFKSLYYLAPFIIAFAIASLMEPVIRVMMFRLKLPRKASAPITLILFISTIGLILVVLITQLIGEVVNLSYMLPRYFSDIYSTTEAFINRANEFYLRLPPQVTKNIEEIISNLTSSLMNVLNSFFKRILNSAISIPEAFIFTFVTIVSTYFLSSDRARIFGYFKSHLPDVWVLKIQSIFQDFFSAFFGYLRAQLILMTITFTELTIGFSLIGVSHPIVIALFTSIVDALPLLGSGSVLIPWLLYELLVGNFRMCLSLFIIYAIVLVVRQMAEPKLLSRQFGLHPLLTLVVMYTGLKLFGFLGLILGPITVLVLKNALSGAVKSNAVKELLTRIRMP